MGERAVKNVLISGASIAGPALAFWLTRYGINTTVVEKSSSLRGGGYPIDIRGTALDAVERMGLYPQMRAAHVDSQSIAFVDEHGAVIAKIDPEAITGGVRGTDVEIRRGDIATILYAATKDKADYKFNDSIASLDEHADRVDVTFVSGDIGTYDIVIGADGLHSNTRSLIFGHESQFEKYIGFCFAGFTVPNTFGLDRGALAYTLPGKNAVVYATNDGGQVYAFLVFRYPTSPFRKSVAEEDKRKLTASMFEGVDGWIVPQLVEDMRKAEDLFFDAVSQIHMPTWSRRRIVLAGDATHATSFLSGQGSSIALVGAYILAGEIATKPDYSSAFEAYEKLMRPFAEMNQALVETGKSIMIPDTQQELEARNEMLRKMAEEPIGKIFRKDDARQVHRRQVHSALTLPDYS
ncbi:FAD-dependent monooxygenase [Bradyrhizobium canariense]|uniref:2-polyprenyl-6-methoxyphenol hydroxylase n=1 Tax=Bradyrhizobium canariense TaxID=255045 RepID=A0A1H1SQG4_9BRAD|nr:FAD-dependent monooxygenase [Bradyrhizobium canariense]SDS50230.1 2-polyprenyl-6-methoxyphenol hydroxylase [Bradyrhizobium canariense]